MAKALRNPRIVANEVALPRDADPTEANVAALETRIAEVERQRSSPMRRIAAIDDDEPAVPFLVELETRGDGRRRLRDDRDALLAGRAGWLRARDRLDDLAWWSGVRAEHLGAPTYEQKRLVLRAVKVAAGPGGDREG